MNLYYDEIHIIKIYYMYNFNDKIEPVFDDYLITIPFIEPIVLKAKMVQNSPAFAFMHEGKEHYIYVAYSYVWKDTLPKSLGENLRTEIMGAVDGYIFKSRQHYLPQLFSMGLGSVN